MRSQLTDNFIGGDFWVLPVIGLVLFRRDSATGVLNSKGRLKTSTGGAESSRSLGQFPELPSLIGMNGYAIFITPFLLTIRNYRRAKVEKCYRDRDGDDVGERFNLCNGQIPTGSKG